LLYLPENESPIPKAAAKKKVSDDEDYDRRMQIRQFVQSGKRKTVQQVLQKFGRDNIVKGNFGRMFAHAHNWEIRGFTVSPTDEAECIGEEDQCAASIRIGETIIRDFLNSEIEPSKPWPWEEKSDYLKPVKDGRCSDNECREQVTADMLRELKTSPEKVFCRGCGVRLFGLGE
jgi:hypothetical protein